MEKKINSFLLERVCLHSNAFCTGAGLNCSLCSLFLVDIYSFGAHVKLNFPLYYSEEKCDIFEVKGNDGMFEAFSEMELIIFMIWAFQAWAIFISN